MYSDYLLLAFLILLFAGIGFLAYFISKRCLAIMKRHHIKNAIAYQILIGVIVFVGIIMLGGYLIISNATMNR